MSGSKLWCGRNKSFGLSDHGFEELRSYSERNARSQGQTGARDVSDSRRDNEAAGTPRPRQQPYGNLNYFSGHNQNHHAHFSHQIESGEAWVQRELVHKRSSPVSRLRDRLADITRLVPKWRDERIHHMEPPSMVLDNITCHAQGQEKEDYEPYLSATENERLPLKQEHQSNAFVKGAEDRTPSGKRSGGHYQQDASLQLSLPQQPVQPPADYDQPMRTAQQNHQLLLEDGKRLRGQQGSRESQETAKQVGGLLHPSARQHHRYLESRHTATESL